MANSRDVCLVSVTYNSRYPLLESMLTRAKEMGIRHAIVADNNCRNTLRELTIEGLDIRHLVFGRNVGTSKAYADAIRMAKLHGHEFVLLLDDDNLPNTDCLFRLNQQFERLSREREGPLAVCARRIGFDPSNRLFPTGYWSKYVTSDLLYPIRRYWQKPVGDTISVENAPYGGLYFRSASIDKLGLPDEKFVVYVDDIEFTARFASEGGLFFVGNAIIVDVERQGISRSYNTLLRNALFYYAVRNQVYFDKSQRRSRVIFRLNSLTYVAKGIAKNLFSREAPPLSVLRDAIRDGEAGQLGFNSKYALCAVEK